jgi:histidine triad (HIT) family protein
MTIFTKIIRGEIPCYKVAETDKFLAFLDVFPLVKGHVLVIPKIETDYIFDIESEEYSELFLFAKKVAIALKKSVPCNKVGVSVIGLEVPHAHIHLIPMNQVSDMNFSKQKLSFPQDEMEATAILISSNF